MNKGLFWIGLSVFILELLTAIGYFIAIQDLSWLTSANVTKFLGPLIIIYFNIFAFICLIIGIERVIWR